MAVPQGVWDQESLEVQSEGALSRSLKPSEENLPVLRELWARGLGPSPGELEMMKHNPTPESLVLGNLFLSMLETRGCI